MKEFEDDNFKLNENGRNFSKRVENTGKRRNCSLRAISLFPRLFSEDLDCRHVKTELVWERVNVGEKLKIVFDRVENTVGKGENAFKRFLSRSRENRGLFVKGLTLYQTTKS